MKDLAISLDGKADLLAAAARALGQAGINIEGGCANRVGNTGVAHFLVGDGTSARTAIERHGLRLIAEREVLVVTIDQEQPGQFAKLAQAMHDGGVRIEAFYGDHEHHEILVVDDIARARTVIAGWSGSPSPTAPADVPGRKAPS